MTAFEKLLAIYGTHEKLAKAFKVKTQAMTYWKKNGVPAIRAKQVEKVTKGEVTMIDVLG